MPFAATWMELENLILSEMSQKGKVLFSPILKKELTFQQLKDSQNSRDMGKEINRQWKKKDKWLVNIAKNTHEFS